MPLQLPLHATAASCLVHPHDGPHMALCPPQPATNRSLPPAPDWLAASCPVQPKVPQAMGQEKGWGRRAKGPFTMENCWGRDSRGGKLALNWLSQEWLGAKWAWPMVGA